jgi:alkylated DNA repair dioxygenase AlkB
MDLISGLHGRENYISEEEQTLLLEYINSQPWDTTLKRRVQHYGHRYRYKVEEMDIEVPPIPEIFITLFKKIRNDQFAEDVPISKLQIIVNEYIQGQGIAPHIDDPRQFGSWVVTVSLGSDCYMDFTKEKKKHSVYLKKGSIYEMKGDARYLWRHSIASRKYDTVNGIKIERGTRVSITFRSLKHT